jgi:hypothetical protein
MQMSSLIELLEKRADSDVPHGSDQPWSRAMARIADAIERSGGNSAKVLRAIEIRAEKTTDPSKRSGLRNALKYILERGTTNKIMFSLPNGDKEKMPTWNLTDSDKKALERISGMI